MLARVDLVPGVAGHDPALGRFVLQHVQVLGLTREHGHHRHLRENAALVALAHQARQVGREGDVEDGVGLAVHDRAERGARLQLAVGGPLLADELDIRALGFQQFLEAGHGALAVLVVGRNRGPALGRQLGRLFNQHGRLHPGARAQPEGVAVALVPDDGVGQGLAGNEHALVLGRVVGQGQADVAEKAAGQHVHLLLGGQLHRMAQRLLGLAAIVAADHLDLAPQQAAGRVDLLHRQLPPLLVGLGELGHRRVAVDLSDPDRRALGEHRRRSQREPHHHDLLHVTSKSCVM
ncbi:MAG: hypothetical protein BWX79_00885 [Alphaproteobacteria bacterium ADurb.Bin100]|nr:MAG: hypothetical protein BWX79_00885 [Alphaproteobacteria bacterium ADurb.Bin100]